MKFRFRPLKLEDAYEIESWYYDGFEKQLTMDPYFESEVKMTKMLGPGGCEGFAAICQGQLAGLFEFYFDTPIMTIGLALKPELVGKGYGRDFVLQGIAFGIEQYSYTQKYVELTVNIQNLSAIRVYQKAGFVQRELLDDEVKMRLKVDKQEVLALSI